MYAVPGNLDLVDSDPDIIEFPRDNLRFVEKLGEGQFGEVSVYRGLLCVGSCLVAESILTNILLIYIFFNYNNSVVYVLRIVIFSFHNLGLQYIIQYLNT